MRYDNGDLEIHSSLNKPTASSMIETRNTSLRYCTALTSILFVSAFVTTSVVSAQTSNQDETSKLATDADQIKSVVIQAFAATHEGYSSDELILKTELNKSFVAACHKTLPDVEAFQFNWTLLNLRKAGKLTVKATKRDVRKFDLVMPVAEMCARMMEDKHGKSIDRLMADPETRQEFDQAALAIDADIETYLVRKAAFRLRKTRQLKPELITRIADWGRKVDEHKASDIEKKPDLIPESPGIYIFRDATGYLYIGEAIDLRARLVQHLGGSDSKTLAGYLADQGSADVTIEVHSFAEDSRISETMVRRAYESELIRSRNPRFNVRP